MLFRSIAIARALLGNPKVLLFDEATSAMDMGAESALLQRLAAEIGNCTFVTITHKASLLQMVDKIVVIDQGRVVMQGTPEQLMRAQQAQAAQAGPLAPAAAPATPAVRPA